MGQEYTYDGGGFEGLASDGACTAWYRTGGPANSLIVTSCSSSCICFTQYANTDLCGAGTELHGTNVKKTCADSCSGPDPQGIYLKTGGFTCDASLVVVDADFECFETTDGAPSVGRSAVGAAAVVKKVATTRRSHAS